jgi:disulfide bond formation protein DsbB
VKHDVTVTLAVLGVVGQVLLAIVVVAGALALAGVRGPLAWLRGAVYGYELWLAFLVALIATGGSLFFSEIADFVPCKLCWIQRIFAYPIVVSGLIAALLNDRRAARYLLPLPVIGLGFAGYHILVERGIVQEAASCQISAPGGCATKWVEEFGYVTIPVLAATAFGLLIALFAFILSDSRVDDEYAPETEEHAGVDDRTDVEKEGRWEYPVAEALLVLLIAGLMTVAAVVGWVVGSAGSDDPAGPTVPAATQTTEIEGADGEAVFVRASCGSCHELAAAGATGRVGPSLDRLTANHQGVADIVRKADDGARTRDPQLGKLMLYQLSYVRAGLTIAQPQIAGPDARNGALLVLERASCCGQALVFPAIWGKFVRSDLPFSINPPRIIGKLDRPTMGVGPCP